MQMKMNLNNEQDSQNSQDSQEYINWQYWQRAHFQNSPVFKCFDGRYVSNCHGPINVDGSFLIKKMRISGPLQILKKLRVELSFDNKLYMDVFCYPYISLNLLSAHQIFFSQLVTMNETAVKSLPWLVDIHLDRSLCWLRHMYMSMAVIYIDEWKYKTVMSEIIVYLDGELRRVL